MSEVFKDLPKGYWRTAENVTMALKDMDTAHLKNVRRFLTEKRQVYSIIRSDPELWEDLRNNTKFPSDLDYIIKLLEVNAELKRRQGDTIESN
jgi:5-bromo-4-chloroindolyl phosphate hydrolysis protein